MSGIRGRPDSDTRLDRVTDGLMAAMLLFLPLAFGGWATWAVQVWFILVALLGVCALLRPIVHRDRPLVGSWAFVPIGLFILLVAFQLLPLPRGLVGAVSPNTLRLKDELLPGLDLPSRSTLTFYPFATVQQLRLVLAAATVFFVVSQFYASRGRIERLLKSVIVAGLVVAAVAVYGDVTQATLIYGFMPIGHKNAGPFQNYSHFSQFMNLSVGGALAFIGITLADWYANGRGRIDWADELRKPGNGWLWAAVSLVAVAPVLVLWSLSRMGMISMLVAGALTAALVGWRGRPPIYGKSGRRRRTGDRANGLFLLLTYGIAVFVVAMVAGYGAVYDRLAALAQADTSTVGRWQILNDLLPLFRQFPLFGTGLGTHEFVFPAFSHIVYAHLFTHAENEYAQLFEECGGIGLLLAVGFLGVVAAAFVRTLRRPERPEHFAAFGLGFGLIAIVLHSFTDFGQHGPANATLTATLAAVMINLARKPDAPDANPTTARLPIFAAGALALFTIVAAWLIYGADVGRRADRAHLTARDVADALEATNWQGDDDAYRGLLSAAARAAELEPTNVDYAYRLAAYRWHLVARDAADPATRKLGLTAESIGFARRIVADLDAARVLCPTYGPPLSVAGQIRLLALQDAGGEQQIRTAYRLTPHDRAVCYALGTLATRRSDWPTADEALMRYIELGGARWHVVDTYLLANRPDLAFKVAAADRWNLNRLAGGLAASWPNEKRLLAGCRALDERLIIEASEAADGPPDRFVQRAALEQRKGDDHAAVAWYQKAVDCDYGQADWRLALAQAQARIDRPADAERNLRVCLRLRPHWAVVESLLQVYAKRIPTSTPD